MRYCRPPFGVILFYDFSSSDHLGIEADGGGEIRRNAADSSGAEDGLLRKTQTEEKKKRYLGAFREMEKGDIPRKRAGKWNNSGMDFENRIH